MGDEEEWKKLPIDKKIGHTVWKARKEGYEEAAKVFITWDEEDPKWAAYLGLARRMVTDSNAVAQEKGLECCLVLAEYCEAAPRIAAEVVEGLVTKCVAAPKTRTKELATKLCLALCEVEAHEKVIETLLDGFSNKNPKVVAGCVRNVAECLRCFGAKVIKISPLLKATVPMLEHRDKNVREEAKKLIIEAYRWVGEVMKTQLRDLKEVIMKELEAEFSSVGDVGKAKPEMWLRSQGPAREGGSQEGQREGGGEEKGAGEEAHEVDPFEMFEPVEILSKLPKNFYEQVAEKKWQDRKEALEALHGLTQNPKLEPGDYLEVVQVLRKIVSKDTNVMVVTLAAQCLTGLAKGLRSEFKQNAKNSLSALLEKFKEKKVNVVTAIKDCVDSFYPILGVDSMEEDCLSALKIKTPSVKSETASFLARCFAKCPPELAADKKLLKSYVTALLETLGEADKNVRESASKALATLWKFLGERRMIPFLQDLDKIKLDKIKEESESVELTGKPAAAAAKARKEPSEPAITVSEAPAPDRGRAKAAPARGRTPSASPARARASNLATPSAGARRGSSPSPSPSRSRQLAPSSRSTKLSPSPSPGRARAAATSPARAGGGAKKGVALRKMIQGYYKDLDRIKHGDTVAVEALAQRMCQELTDTLNNS